MRGGSLEFRSSTFVALAFAIAPIVAGLALWLTISVAELLAGRYSIDDALSALPYVVATFGLLGFVVELLMLTPFIWAMSRYRWAWMNGWWFAGFGLAAGEAGNLLMDLFGPRHWYGWGSVVQGALVSGFVALIGSAVFYVIALRRVDPTEAAASFG